MYDPLIVFIDAVFDHPVNERAWYWDEDAPGMPAHDRDRDWYEPPVKVLEHLAETFERGGELLSRFSNEQLDQGFWLLFDTSGCVFMSSLLDEGVPPAVRLRVLRSWVPLFEQVMAARCASYPFYEPELVNALNSACCMWFDCLLDRFEPEKLTRSALAEELPLVLKRVLAIPHDACRGGALHGIGHWVRCFPQLVATVDEFLASTPDLRPELVEYAHRARIGNVR